MKCIYCQRKDPPCAFYPLGVSTFVLGEYRMGAVCHDCYRILRSPERQDFMSKLTAAMASASDT